MIQECPHCPAIWTQEEIDEQYCFACGWPNVKEDEDEYDFDDDFEDEQCQHCGLTGDHSIECPESNNPFHKLIQTGHD